MAAVPGCPGVGLAGGVRMDKERRRWEEIAACPVRTHVLCLECLIPLSDVEVGFLFLGHPMALAPHTYVLLHFSCQRALPPATHAACAPGSPRILVAWTCCCDFNCRS